VPWIQQHLCLAKSLSAVGGNESSPRAS